MSGYARGDMPIRGPRGGGERGRGRGRGDDRGRGSDRGRSPAGDMSCR